MIEKTRDFYSLFEKIKCRNSLRIIKENIEFIRPFYLQLSFLLKIIFLIISFWHNLKMEQPKYHFSLRYNALIFLK